MTEYFPDGTLIDSWFYDTSVPSLNELGTQYSLKDFGIPDDGTVQTSAIQALIDRAAENGGGVIVVPEGTWISGALYFPGNVNLYIEKNAVLKGSEHLHDYPLCTTRIEGQTCTYFPALINVINSDGFRLCGEGTIDGSGQFF